MENYQEVKSLDSVLDLALKGNLYCFYGDKKKYYPITIAQLFEDNSFGKICSMAECGNLVTKLR